MVHRIIAQSFLSVLIIAAVLTVRPAVAGADHPASEGVISSGYRWVIFDVPGAYFTTANAINNRGDIVGSYFTAQVQHLYVRRGGQFITLNVPIDPQNTWFYVSPSDMNDRGDIVGITQASGQFLKGFYYRNGVFQQFDRPAFSEALPIGIDDIGDIVGFVVDPSFESFLYHRGVFQTLNPVAPTGDTVGVVVDINKAGVTIAGLSMPRGEGGLESIPHAPPVEIFDPLGTQTVVRAINNRNDIVGTYYDAQQFAHGFIYHHGTYSTLDLPFQSQSATWMNINDRCEVVGSLVDPQTGRTRGFVGYPLH